MLRSVLNFPVWILLFLFFIQFNASESSAGHHSILARAETLMQKVNEGNRKESCRTPLLCSSSDAEDQEEEDSKYEKFLGIDNNRSDDKKTEGIRYREFQLNKSNSNTFILRRLRLN